MEFKRFYGLAEGWIGHLMASVLMEARRRPSKGASLWDEFPGVDEAEPFVPHKKLVVPEKDKQLLGPDACPITPLSGYERHITAIQKYAKSGPDQFAQVLMFSPLSANVGFAKHWDNYQTLMLILRYFFGGEGQTQEMEPTAENLKSVIELFNKKYHRLNMTINGFKYETIAYVWGQREKLMTELNALAAEGDDEKLIARLAQIPGVESVKAGFIAQLLWGRAGCIDTHNIDIYSRVFPHMKDDLNPSKWDSKKKGGVRNYTNVLRALEKTGIGTKQLWDVWVDFVETMYKMISSHGKGMYTDMGAALDPNDPVYQQLKGVKIPKRGIGNQKLDVDVPLASGRGFGASATHLPMDPDEALSQFHKMYRGSDREADIASGSDAARAVAFHVDKYGRPQGEDSGLRHEPTLTQYFDPALTRAGEVDPEMVKKIIRDRINKRAAQPRPQDMFAGVAGDPTLTPRRRRSQFGNEWLRRRDSSS